MPQVRFIGYQRQYQIMKAELDAVWHEIMSGGDFIMRRHLKEFEKNIAEYVGVKHAIGVNTGTDALYLSTKVAGFKPGDEVISVGHTFVATVASIAEWGATPVLADVRDDYNIDPKEIEKKITSKTRGIIPVHLNGHACEMDPIMELAKKHNLTVIEDAAQALGATYKGKKAASFGMTGIFSFYPAKLLGTPGDGGMVCTNDDEVARKIFTMRDNGRYDNSDVVECYGYCTRLDNLHAAILNVKFKHYQQWIERRRAIAARYDEGLQPIRGVKGHPASGKDFFDVYQNYVIRAERRDELFAYLKEKGVETLISWRRPLHQQKALGLGHFSLPVTDKIAAEVISLPMFPELLDEEVDYVVKTIGEFFS